MHTPDLQLLNTDAIEIWPAALLRARRNADARTLARASHVLRRKDDGRFLGAQLPHRLQPLIERLSSQPGLADALALLGQPQRRGALHSLPATLPVQGLYARLQGLGLDPDGYAQRTGLSVFAEPAVLPLAGIDRYRRALWLTAAAGRSWQRMRAAAATDGILLEAISGYRSHAYQLGIFRRKLARGLSVAQILGINAAPGFSEHHSGRALDISSRGEPAAEESFEHTAAYAWLQQHAARFGFHLSYPRDNPHGICFEPWHWCHHDSTPGS